MKRLLVILLIPVIATGCCIIDDDLSGCGANYVLNYRLQLHTTLSVQLQTELSADTDAALREALARWFAPIFTDRAHDVDLRFFTDEQDELHQRIREVINDNKSSYTIYLPKENFMHLAIANIADNNQLRIFKGEHAATMELRMRDTSDVQSINAGVFTARLPMEVNDSVTSFDVHLYMVTAAVALVIDPTNCPDLVSLDGYMRGSADRFYVRDSVFTYTRGHRIILDTIQIYAPDRAPARARIPRIQDERLCFGAVGLPTQDDQPWEVKFTATLTDNRHTTTSLMVDSALTAGSLRIIQCAIGTDGGIEPEGDDAKDIGATVELDWEQGSDYEIDI